MNLQFFFRRLREEREARGLTQDAMAQNVGVSKRSYCAYEAGETAPSAKLLAALACMGIDVAYLLTGERNPSLPAPPPPGPALSADEAELLSDYRESHPVVQRSIKTLLREAASSSGGGVATPPRRRKRA